MANPNYNSLLATTLNNFRDTLTDNILSGQFLLNFLNMNGRVSPRDGGVKIIEQIQTTLNTTFSSYSTYDTLTTTAQDPFTAAEYPWAQVAATVSVAGIEKAQNHGKPQMIDLVKSKMKNAEDTISEKLDQMLFLDGTGNSNKDFLGLKALVGDTGVGPAVVGGITVATDAYWRSPTDSATEALGLAKLTNVYNRASVGNAHPNVALTTQALYEKYESLLQPNQRFTDAKSAQAGFDALLYKGRAPVYWDTYCEANKWYFVNSDNLKLVTNTEVWMKATDFVRPNNQDAEFVSILAYGNLVANNRARHGLLYNKS